MAGLLNRATLTPYFSDFISKLLAIVVFSIIIFLANEETAFNRNYLWGVDQ
jgi:hypothetical protein